MMEGRRTILHTGVRSLPASRSFALRWPNVLLLACLSMASEDNAPPPLSRSFALSLSSVNAFKPSNTVEHFPRPGGTTRREREGGRVSEWRMDLRYWRFSVCFCRRRRRHREMKRDDSVVEYRSSKKLTFSFSLFLPFSSFVWCSRLRVLGTACLNEREIKGLASKLALQIIAMTTLDRHFNASEVLLSGRCGEGLLDMARTTAACIATDSGGAGAEEVVARR